jgi:hypothetical protein
LKDFDTKIDEIRKKIVATTEGGAITGEERLREHTDQLYGALLSYEGKPGEYQLAYIEALKREFLDVSNEFSELTTKDLPPVNEALKAKNQPPLALPPEKVASNNEDIRFGADGSKQAGDPDAAPASQIALPANFLLLH